jgi:DNA-binding PadR family transcriptional regulator
MLTPHQFAILKKLALQNQGCGSGMPSTGHGWSPGALAALERKGYVTTSLITFGSPRRHVEITRAGRETYAAIAERNQ